MQLNFVYKDGISHFNPAPGNNDAQYIHAV